MFGGRTLEEEPKGRTLEEELKGKTKRPNSKGRLIVLNSTNQRSLNSKIISQIRPRSGITLAHFKKTNVLNSCVCEFDFKPLVSRAESLGQSCRYLHGRQLIEVTSCRLAIDAGNRGSKL